MLQTVKIYGERNSGTRVLERAVRMNFSCELLRGTVRQEWDQIRRRADASALKGLERAIFLESLADDAAARLIPEHFGWKHGCPPLKAIAASKNLDKTLFVVITKDPYSWLLSLYERPYHQLHRRELSFAEFVRFSWLTVRRDNTRRSVLDNPVQLYELKLRSYERLKDTVKHFLHIRYRDFLLEYEEVMLQLNGFLERSSETWRKPEESSKDEGVTFDDYRRKYENGRLDELRADDIRFINSQLRPELLSKWGYAIANPEQSVNA